MTGGLLFAEGASTCGQEADLVAFQNSASQPPGEIRPSIDVDPVGTYFGALGGRVPVDNNLSEIDLTPEKFVADPQQIVTTLTRQRYVWADPGVTHEVSIQGQGRFKRGEEHFVGGWKRGAKGGRGRIVSSAVHHGTDFDTIGMECLKPPYTAPDVADRWIGEKALDQSLVVTLQRHEPRRKRIVGEPFNDLSGVRPAINVIAQRDCEALCRRGSLQIADNHPDHDLEKVRSAVNVADNVNSTGGWRHRDLSGRGVGSKSGGDSEASLALRPALKLSTLQY